MEGFESHNNWMYNHTLPPSNLSAFAAPFTVNRGDSSAPPFMDLSDTLSPNPNHFPANTRSYEYTFFPDPKTKLDSPTPPSNPYAFSYCGSKVSDPHGSQIPHMDQSSNTTKSNLAEVHHYFPSYVSPVINDHNSSVSSVIPNHWSSFSRFTTTLGGSPLGDYADESPELGFGGKNANQFAEFNRDKGKSVGIETSFSSNQTNVAGSVVEKTFNLGYQDIKDNNAGVRHMTDWETNSVPSADQLDDKSYWWASVKPSQVEFSETTIQQPASLSLETHHEVPLELSVNSGNHHFSFTGAYDKDSRQQDKPSRVDTVSSTPMMVSAADLINHNSVAYGNPGHNNFYNIKEAYPMSSLGTAGCFDIGHLRMHLERIEPSSSNNTMTSDRNVSMDAVDYTHKARHGFENHHLNLDNLSLRLGATEDANSIEKSFMHGDMCNPAVDSPCWKGAPTTCFSHYEALEALPPEHVHKNVEFFGSVIQEVQNFLPDRESNVKMSYDRSNRCQVDIGIVDEETSSASSRRKFLETNFGSADCNSDGAVNAEHFESEPSCDYGLHYREDVTKMKESSVPPTKPIDCESGYSHDEHQVIKENKLVSQKSYTLSIGGTDAGCNENKSSESGTPLSAEHVLSSPSSAANAPPTSDESAGKLSVQMLVDAMQNMSELLLNHCLNDDICELKERDCDVLRNVISNLNSCVLKNAEEITPAQECLLHQRETSKCAGESCELQQNVHLKEPQSTKTGPESSKVECEGYLHFGSGKPRRISLDAIPLRGDAETTKAEKMTKALKKILSENFDGDDDVATESQTALYKNLWLDAEAALCSVTYRARYNQMKIEMGMEEQSKDEVIPILSKSQSSATEVHNNPHPDSSAQNLPVLDATNPNARFKISINRNEPNPLKSEGEGRQGLNSFIQNNTVSGSNKEAAGNDEMETRMQLEMMRLLTALDNNNDLEKPSEVADKLVDGEIDSQNKVIFCQDSPISGNNEGGYEASVLARFDILKARDEGLSSLSSEETWFDGAGPSGKEIEDTIINGNASEGKNLDAHLNSHTDVDKSISNDVDLDLYVQEIEAGRTYEFPVPNYYSDGCASDWEHI